MGSAADHVHTQLTLPILPRAALLFARAPRVEQEVKPFGPRGEEIHRALLVAVLTAIRGLPPTSISCWREIRSGSCARLFAR